MAEPALSDAGPMPLADDLLGPDPIPPLPPGFTLLEDDPPPPPGFTIDPEFRGAGAKPLPLVDDLLGPDPVRPAPPIASNRPGGDQVNWWEQADAEMSARAPLVDTLLKPRVGNGSFSDKSGRVMAAAGDAVKTLFSGEKGFSDETLGPLFNQSPDDVTSPLGLFRTFNRVVLEGGSAAVDITMRAVAAPIFASVAAVGQVMREAGMSDGDTHRLERDLLELPNAVAAAVGAGPIFRNMRMFRMAARERIAATVDDLPPEAAGTAPSRAAAAFDEGIAIGKREAGDADALPPLVDDAAQAGALTEPRITQALTKEVVDAAGELLTLGGVQRAEGRLISDQIMELLQTKRLTTEQIGAVLEKNNLTPDAFAELWRVNIRKAAQDMQALSALEQRVKALNKLPGAEGELAALQEAAGLGANERGLNWWRRVENVRRGMLVTQLSTAVRNFETQVGRVGLDTLQQGLDDALRKTFSAPGVREANPTDAFGTLANIFRRPVETKGEVDAILGAFPKEQDRLFNSWMSEYQTGMFGKAEAVVNALNIANRFQENIVRRAVFQSRLAVEMDKLGKPLDDIIARNAVGEIPREAVESAVNGALEMTFSKNFSPFAPGAEGMAGTFINTINKFTPFTTILIPFPRFLMNAVKFQYEWSPAGYLKLLSPTERAKIAAGDMSAISRPTIGTGLLLTAYQFRDSEYAGEKWYELRLPDGETVDMRPFNPFASYLFLADLAKRRRDGTLDQLTGEDVLMGVLATQLRAGTGAYAVDTVLTELAGLEASEKAWQSIQNLAGNYLSGFAVPFNMVTDFLAEFDEASRVVRTGKEGPVVGPVNVGPIIRNIPGLGTELPESRNPLREGPILREAPAVKQFTGALINAPKNAVEKEVDRLGITWKEYFPSSGDPTADRMIATQMGMIVERALPQLVESDGYKSLSNPVKAYVLLNALKGARTAAKEIVAGQEPALTARMKLEGLPTRQRKAINDLTNGSIDAAIQQLRGMSGE